MQGGVAYLADAPISRTRIETVPCHGSQQLASAWSLAKSRAMSDAANKDILRLINKRQVQPEIHPIVRDLSDLAPIRSSPKLRVCSKHFH